MFLGQRYGSVSFYHQAKIVRKTSFPTALWLLFDFLYLKNDVNVPSKSNKQKNFFISFLLASWRSTTKIARSRSASTGYISHRHGTADLDPDPDPHQNVMDPHQRLLTVKKLGLQILASPSGPHAWPTRRWMGYLPASSLAEPRHSPAILSLKKKKIQLTDWFITRQARVTDGLDLLSPNITMNSPVKKVPVWSPLLTAQVCSPKISLQWQNYQDHKLLCLSVR